jgi:hypothetical protein
MSFPAIMIRHNDTPLGAAAGVARELSDYAASVLPRGWLRGLRAGPPYFTLIFRNSLRKTINGLDNPDPR